MNTRRDFLQSIWMIPLLSPAKEQNDENFTYKDWEVRWMGWHRFLPYAHQYCMYMAKYQGEGDIILYASYPGKSGIANPRIAIDTYPQEEKGQVTVCPLSTPAELKKYQLICKKDLIKVIDEYGTPKEHSLWSKADIGVA